MRCLIRVLAVALALTSAAGAQEQIEAHAAAPNSTPSAAGKASRVDDANSTETTQSDAPVALGESLSGQAKADYEAGRKAFEGGDYAQALIHFEHAYAVARDPRLLWNAAACERQMGHFAKAIRFVRRYLGTPADLSAAAIGRARAFIEAAEPLTAGLSVRSSQVGAIVALDSEILGTIPLDPDLRVDPGQYRLRVSKEGYADFEQTLEVRAGMSVVVQASLQRLRQVGTLTVRAPELAAIAVDGVRVGTGRWSGTLQTGTHWLQVTAEDFHPYQANIRVARAAPQTVVVELEPLPRRRRASKWLWIASGAVLAVGGTVAGYALLRSDDDHQRGTLATVEFP